MNAKVEKEYVAELCELPEYFVQHKDSNHLNAQDVVHTLVEQAKNLASVGQLLWDETDKKYNCSDDTLFNLFWDIETKLKLIDKQLSKAFKYDEHSVE